MPELIGATCDVQALLDIDPCKAGLNPYLAEVVRTQIYCEIKNFYETGETPTCDIQTLLDNAVCFGSLNEVILAVIQTQLLCDILTLIVNPPDPPPEEEIVWDGGDEPTFECAETKVDLSASYYFGIFQEQNPNGILSVEQRACMIDILDVLIADYITANGGTVLSRQNWWAFTAATFVGYSGVSKAGSGVCDPNDPTGNVNVLFNGAYYPAVQICWQP